MINRLYHVVIHMVQSVWVKETLLHLIYVFMCVFVFIALMTAELFSLSLEEEGLLNSLYNA